MINESTVEAAKGGDRQALRSIVDAYRDPLFRYSYRIVGNATDAEDVLQETFVRMISGLRELPPGVNLRAWLFKIATNLSIDRKREAGRPTPPAPAAPPGPGATAESRELVRAAEQALAQLPEKQRAALVLRVIEGFPYRTIADILDTTENNARWYLFEARRQMRQSINGNL